MPVPSDIALTPDERQLCEDIDKAREHLAQLEEDLRMLMANRQIRVNPELLSDDGK